MGHKVSCRVCGRFLVATAICTVCQEDVIWVCQECGWADDVTHIHDFCRVAYKKIEIKVRQKQ